MEIIDIYTVYYSDSDRTRGVKFLIPHQSANVPQVLKIAHDMVIGKVIPFSVCVKQAVSELMLNANRVI